MKYRSFLGTVCFLSLSLAVAHASLRDEQEDTSFTSMNSQPAKEEQAQDKQPSEARKQTRKHRKKKSAKGKENIPPQTAHLLQEKIPTVSGGEESAKTPQKSLSQKVEDIRLQVQEGFKEASADKIYQAFRDFEALKGKKKWEALGRELSLSKNSSQKSWKDTVGASLFSLEDIMTWEDHYSDKYKFRRRDTLWALAIGARYNDPLSKFYLAKILWGIHWDCTEVEDRYPNIIWELFDEATAELMQQQDNFKCYYTLWKGSQPPLYNRSKHDKNRIFDLAEKGDLRSQFEVLGEKSYNVRDFPTRPTPEDYYDLGERGFYPAYVQAARLEKEFGKKIEILQRAVEKGYAPALLNLGCRYYDNDDEEKARMLYHEAASQGIAEGYIELGVTYVGDDDYLEDLENVKGLSEEDIQEGIRYFTLAGEVGHPEGWDSLIRLNRALARVAFHTKGKNTAGPFMSEMFEAVKKGMALGSLIAYGAGRQHFSKEAFEEVWESLSKLYGPSFKEDAFCQRVEAFVRKKKLHL